MNRLLELITPHNVIYDFNAETKEDVIRKLINFGIINNLLDKDIIEEIVESLLNRENSMSTGIGSGVAIPHCSISLVNELKVIIGLSKTGIEFDAIDKLPVHIFILLIVPKDKFQDHIKTLALIAKTLNLREEREKLIQSNSYEELVSALINVQ
jgi:mannitol/fructose-specific phosphotransferase system IIA component (Ntr-type)